MIFLWGIKYNVNRDLKGAGRTPAAMRSEAVSAKEQMDDILILTMKSIKE